MGSVETRPTQNAYTSVNVQIGVPFLEFGELISPGVYGAYRAVGIVNEETISKEIEKLALKSAHSGVDVLVREMVRSLEARINVSTWEWSWQNLALAFASATNTQLNAGTTAVANEAVIIPVSPSWVDLQNQMVDDSVAVDLDPATVTDEDVGTGDGTLGAASGEYSLDWKVAAVADITGAGEITVAGVAFTAIAVGAAAAGNEVEVVVGTGTDSGDLQFFVGGAPADVTGAILATYTPSHAPAENTDYSFDYDDGRVRAIATDEAGAMLRTNQPVLVDYSYTSFDGYDLAPFTQQVFEGRARLRLLTDSGINIVWPIPLVNVLISDEDVEFSREDFGVLNMIFTLVADDSDPTYPYGHLKVYDENAA